MHVQSCCFAYKTYCFFFLLSRCCQGRWILKSLIASTVTPANGNHFHVRGGVEGYHWSTFIGNLIFQWTFRKTYVEMMNINMKFTYCDIL